MAKGGVVAGSGSRRVVGVVTAPRSHGRGLFFAGQPLALEAGSSFRYPDTRNWFGTFLNGTEQGAQESEKLLHLVGEGLLF